MQKFCHKNIQNHKYYFDFFVILCYTLYIITLFGGGCLYSIGENIVYPMHGAGTIIGIEEKEILGKMQKYYVVKIPASEIKLMVPVSTADEVGVRQVTEKSELNSIFEEIKASDEKSEANWNKRYRENLSRIKSGSIIEVGKVVKSLTLREESRALSTYEKKMLTNAKNILVSELALAKEDVPENIERDLYSLIIK